MDLGNRLRIVVLLVLAWIFAGMGMGEAWSAKPNVVLILADDLGLGDLGATNDQCKIKTPHLDKLATQGITFLDAHTPSSVCTPTRYGLLTGRYNWRSRLARGVLSGTSEHLIPKDRPTLAHLMKKAGYQTAMIGKWHLGWDWHQKDKKIDFTKPVKNGPDINGFDYYYAHCGSLDMPPYVWVETGKITAQPTKEEGVTRKEDPYGWYRKGPISPDFNIPKVLPHLFEKSIDYIQSKAKASQTDAPFFLYLALPAPHTPIVPLPPFKDASKLNPYADFVMQVDHHMGQLLKALDEAGIGDQTLVIFTSDNGCSPVANFPLLQEKGHYPSAQFRGHKADIFEGGHRVPMIARWPGRIKAGQRSNAVVCLTDVYATLGDITGQKVENVGGEDGYSLQPVFEGKDTTGRNALVSHSIDGSFSIRQGDWKLCLCAGSGGWSSPRERDAKKKGLPPLQLYNLSNDPAEKKNVAKQHPKQVQQLLTLLKKIVDQGRSTSGEALKNDRKVTFLPPGVTMP